MNDVRIMFGKQLRKLRKEAKVTQIELAELLDVSKGTVAMWEISTRMPPIEKIVEISDLFRVSIDYLVRGYESKEL